jgi:hypothetical protein
LGRWASSVPVKRDSVDREREADEVEVLAGVPDAMGSTKPHGVVEVPIDGFGVVAAWFG